MRRDRRGVSETVGFVLVFSLVLLTVGTVFTVGYGGLQDARDAERVNNAERAFDVLANNLEDITDRGAPSRGTEIRLAEASIGTGTPTTLNVSATGTNASYPAEYTLDPIVYEAQGTRIRYAGGAVTRIQPAGSVLLDGPGFVVSDDRVIVPVVELTVADRTISGSQTVLVRSVRREGVTDLSDSDVDRLWLNVTTPADQAWAEYLDGQGMACHRPAGSEGPVACSTDDVDHVQVVRFWIDVSFE